MSNKKYNLDVILIFLLCTFVVPTLLIYLFIIWLLKNL